MNKGTHRVTPTSKAGRGMISPGRISEPWRVLDEVQDWNAQVEAKKAAKKADKQAITLAEFRKLKEQQCRK